MKLFYSKLEFLLSLKNNTNIDFDKTTNCSGWGFVTKDGRTFFGRNFTQYLEAMNEMLDTKFDIVHSVRLGTILKVFYTQDPVDIQETPVIDSENDSVKDEPLSEETVETSVEATEEDSNHVSEETNPLSDKLDWGMINSLQNKKYDKEKLEKHALEITGINLNKRFTLENMIIQLKEELSKL